MALTVSKSMSLVEQKRLQWAREREEMAGLCAPWGPPPNRDNRDTYRSAVRTHYMSTMELNQTANDAVKTKQQIPMTFNESVGRVRRRSPSLPPIYTRTAQNGQEDEDNAPAHENEDEGETETSGYASESGGNEPRQGDFWHQQQAASWVNEQHRHHQHVNRQSILYNRGYTTPDSAVSTPPNRWSCISSDESNRPRWGDKGVGVGHLWEPTFHEPDCRLPQVQGSDRGTPSWLERGLSKLDDSQMLVINHGPEPNSNLSCSLTGSCDTISTINTQAHSECSRTFLRGQNVPLEPDVLLERERKRQKALELQNAIRQQLEERDRKRKDERERRAREEREEEERIRRENEREKLRIEEEFRKQKEKEEKEARKAKAMREALEKAQKLARQEKLRARAKHITENKEDEDCETKSSNKVTEDIPTSWYKNKKQLPEVNCNQSQSSTNSIDKNEPVKSNSEEVISQPITNKPSNVALVADAVALPADGLAVVLGPAQSSDGSISGLTHHEMLPTSGSAVQLALLMSPNTNLTGPPIVVENRLLTPTRYRHHARGTQTDTEIYESRRIGRSKTKRDNSNNRRERKKSASLDRPHRGCKLPLRCRSLSQPNQQRLSIEDRPKWGVNRPPMQYVKQSERDPYYQRRLRQKLLRASMMGGSNGSGSHIGSFGSGGGGETGTESDTCTQRRIQRRRHGSSEENSRSPSPQQNSFPRQKNMYFRQQSQKYSDRSALEKQDVSVISLDLSVLDSLENQVVSDRRKDSLNKNQLCSISSPNKKVQMFTPISNMPQRFSDNFSRRKSNDIISVSSPSLSKTFNNKGYSQRLLHRKSQPQISLDIRSSGNMDQWSSQDILSQLSSLRQGLLIKQQEWENRRSQGPFAESW